MNPSFVLKSQMISVKNFAIYFNNRDQLLFPGGPILHRDLFETLSAITYGRSESPVNYLLNPVSGAVRATFQRSKFMNFELPKIAISGSLDQLFVSIDEKSFSQLIEMIDWMIEHNKRKRVSILSL